MPSFSMEELKKSLGISATVSPMSHSKNQREAYQRVGQIRGRTVDETKTLIKKALTEAGRPMSFTEICAYLERKQTPHLRKMLHEMGDSGELIEEADIAPSRMMTRFWYSLPR